jgi:hypothetical protein
MAKGFIYIAKNQAMPGLLKVGYTEKVPTARINELFTTGVPEPFEIAYYCLVENAKSLERTIHQRLESYRSRKNREFFCVELEPILQAVSSLCTPEHEWQPPKPPNKEIVAYSRHGIVSEEKELENFVRIATEQSLEQYIEEAFYDSNSCCCFFKLAGEVEEFSPIAEKILAVALETISQFEWFGYIQHGKTNEF